MANYHGPLQAVDCHTRSVVSPMVFYEAVFRGYNDKEHEQYQFFFIMSFSNIMGYRLQSMLVLVALYTILSSIEGGVWDVYIGPHQHQVKLILLQRE